MRTLKQLLWFVIPTVIIWVLLILSVVIDTSQFPRFIGPQNYLRLFLTDTVFLKALINTIALPLLYAVISGIVVFVLFTFLHKKSFTKIYYICLFAVPAFLFHFTAHLKSFMGLPASAYSAHTLLLSSSSHIRYINLPSILISLQVGILVCFIFWCIDLIINKRKKTN